MEGQKSAVSKLNQALYFDAVMQSDMDQLMMDGVGLTPEEYEQKCNELISQKLYVENKAIDVIHFMEVVEQRALFLQEKKKELNEMQKSAESWQARAKKVLKEWFISKKQPKLEIEEYQLSTRKSEGLIIAEGKEEKIPEEFKTMTVTMTLKYYNDLTKLIEAGRAQGATMSESDRIKTAIDDSKNLHGEMGINTEELKKWLTLKGSDGKRINSCQGAYLEERQNLQIKG